MTPATVPHRCAGPDDIAHGRVGSRDARLDACDGDETWDQEDHTLRGLNRTDQDFLVGAGLALGTFGYLEVRPALETTAEGVVLAYDSDIAIVCTSSGVVAAEPEGPRLANTTAESFAASMHRMARYTREVRAAEDDDEALDIVHAMIGELREIDPAACLDARSYWPVVAEQMDAGLL